MGCLGGLRAPASFLSHDFMFHGFFSTIHTHSGYSKVPNATLVVEANWLSLVGTRPRTPKAMNPGKERAPKELN